MRGSANVQGTITRSADATAVWQLRGRLSDHRARAIASGSPGRAWCGVVCPAGSPR